MEIGMLAIGMSVMTGIGAGIGIGIATGKAQEDFRSEVFLGNFRFYYRAADSVYGIRREGPCWTYRCPPSCLPS